MALSMDEQRMLAEIERRLAAEDPGLATRLSSFRRHAGPGAGMRTPKGRLIMLACMITLIAVISAVVYVLAPFRAHPLKTPSSPQSSNPSLVVGGSGADTGSPAAP